MKQKQTYLQPVSGKQRDSCFLLQDDSVAFVTEKKNRWHIGVYPCHQTSNLFEKPCQSKLLDIAFIGSTRRMAITQLRQSQDLKTKAVCLSHCGGYAIFPLLHHIEWKKRRRKKRNFFIFYYLFGQGVIYLFI